MSEKNDKMDMKHDSKSLSQSLIERFSSKRGKDLLIRSLLETNLFRNISNLDKFIENTSLIELEQGDVIIEQDASDNDIYVVVSGCFNILVNGRIVASRTIGSHFGEMALIDPTARRSASVIASQHSLLLKCSEEIFSDLANEQPDLWRRIAVELSRRLSERNKYLKLPRSEPVLFVGCSAESLAIAREIQSQFDHDRVTVELWTDGIFNVSHTPIEDLTDLMSRIDFGALILTADDLIKSRQNETFGPRDNVIFELGLVMGAIGRTRTIMLVPRGVDLKIPSDLLGVKAIDYPTGDVDAITSRLAPACNELRKLISKFGPV